MSTLTPDVAATPSASPNQWTEIVDAVGKSLGASDTSLFSWQGILYTVFIFVACLVVMRVVMSLLEHTFNQLRIERTVHTFIKSTAQILMWIVTLVFVGIRLGIDPTALIGVMGLVGLAVSLAIQGTLANLAGGIMVLVSKPFVVGDYVEVDSEGGTVADISLVYTKIKTFDNKIIYIPNGQISNKTIINYTDQETRRADLGFGVSYDAKPEEVKALMLKVIGRHPKTLFTPEPFVRMTEIKDSCVMYTARVWCATDDYWEVYYDLLEQMWDAFCQAGVDLTYNHMNVHILDQPKEAGAGIHLGKRD